MKPVLLLGLLLLSPLSGFCRTRADVIADAEKYATAGWTPSTANLLDVKKYVAGSTIPVSNASDGIDDRMGLINDVNEDGVINSGDITAINRSRWPFATGQLVVGEAYAWGYGHHLVPAMKRPDASYAYVSFSEYLGSRIAGARPRVEVDHDGQNIGNAGDNSDYTGLDCSGFVTRAWGFKSYHYGTISLVNFGLEISTENLKPGDVVISTGDHVVLFTEWISSPSVARIIHASLRNFSKSETYYRVSLDSATILGEKIPGTLNATPAANYRLYSPFPQFTFTTPAAPYQELDPIDGTVSVRIDSALALTKVELSMDPGAESSATAKMGVDGLTLDVLPAGEGKGLTANWAIGGAFVLSEGTHSLVAYAMNDLGLEDWATTYFYIGPDNFPPAIAWTDRVNIISSTPAGEYTFGMGDVSGAMSGELPAEAGRWFHSSGASLELSDPQNALSTFTIYSDGGDAVYHKNFLPSTKQFAISDFMERFPDGTGYSALLQDRLGNASTMYFHVDRGTPTVAIANIVSRLKPDLSGHIFDISGTATDVTSGLDGEVLRISKPEDLVGGYSGVVWPPSGIKARAFAFYNSTGTIRLAAYDRSGWLGQAELGIEPVRTSLRLSSDWIQDTGVYGESGVIISSVSLQALKVVPEITPQPGTQIVWLNQPTGMKVEVMAEAGPAPADGPPMTYGFAQEPYGPLVSAGGAGIYEQNSPKPFGPSVRLRLASTPNTNTVNVLLRTDINGDGTYETETQEHFNPGEFSLLASATIYASYENVAEIPVQAGYLVPGPKRFLQFGKVGVEVSSVVVGGPITIERGKFTVRQPGYKMAESSTVYEIKTTAIFTGKVKIRMELGELPLLQQKEGAKIFHCDENMACLPEDTRLDGDAVVIEVDHLSPFALMIPCSV